jgi:hypothetical protein
MRGFGTRLVPPQQPTDLNPSNRFASRVRIALHAVGPYTLYHSRTLGPQTKAFTEGLTYRMTTAGAPTGFGCYGVRTSTASTLWSSRTYPADLVPSKKIAVVVCIHGKSDTWASQAIRLFDTSSGASLRMDVSRQSSTQSNIRILSFGDTGAPNTLFDAPPRMPLVLGFVHTGGGEMRIFGKGHGFPAQLVGTDTVTLDAAPGGADCRLDFGGSTGADVDYAAGFWLTEENGQGLTDAEMIEFMDNPWQVFMPDPVMRTQKRTAAGASFKAAWARGANTVISTGAMTA